MQRKYIYTHKLVFSAGDIGDIHVVGGRRYIFLLTVSQLAVLSASRTVTVTDQLFTSEDLYYSQKIDRGIYGK